MGVSLARQPKADGRVLVRPPGDAVGGGGTLRRRDFDLLGKLDDRVTRAWL